MLKIKVPRKLKLYNLWIGLAIDNPKDKFLELSWQDRQMLRCKQVGNLSSLTKKSRAETKLIAFTFKTKQKVTKKLF
jgi:hypothetical protein